MRASLKPARNAALAVLLSLGVCVGPARAVQPDEVLPDPVLEGRARALSRDLRCMVCQNQSIDESDAPLARDLRLIVRERLRTGESDGQVLDFLTARYGEFVLLKPRWAWHTAVLWLAPLLALAAGAAAILFGMRQRPKTEAPRLGDDEERRLREFVGH